MLTWEKKMKRKRKVKKQKGKITKDMTFAEVVSKYPKVTKVFLRYEMHCIGCPIAMQETIAQGAVAHGIDVNKLVEELNKAVKAKKK